MVAESCDWVYVMYAGRIVEEGPVGRLFAHPSHPYTQALLNATPSIELAQAELAAIPGRIPSPYEIGPGCRWCLIHATHMTPDETERLAESGAVAGLCPLTEASLGDGTFAGPAFLRSGGSFGIGTDSNIQIDAAAELRQLEYSQRLHHRGRNLMTLDEGESTGRRLFTSALAGGAQAMGQPMGALAPGQRADFVVLDPDHPALAAAGPESWLDCWIFSAGRALVKDVVAGGRQVVSDGRHHRRDAIAARYRASLARLVGEV